MKLYTIFFLLICTFQIAAQYEIGHQSFSFSDPDRNNREVWGEVYYPSTTTGDNVPLASGQFPLIVFGHGFGMAWSEYSIWWETLVEDGYIIAFPRTENAIFPFPDHEAFALDLAFIVDSYMTQNANTNSDFYQHLSEENAIMGHSMGGGCSYLAAENANIKTIVTMAAADTNPSAITAAANINIPVLTIAGAADCVVQEGGTPLDIYNGLTSTSYKAYVEITDASHCQFGLASFGSICTTGEFCSNFLSIEEQHNQMFLNAHSWLDYFLKNDCSRWNDFKNNLYNSTFHTYLESGALPEPEVILNASSLNICQGETTTITAEIDKNHCDIQWFLDNAPINDVTTLTYPVNDPGTYTVIVYNADSQSSISSITIEEHENPIISINQSDNILETIVSGGSNFTYEWYYNGNVIIDEENATLNIENTGDGDYYVIVTNEFGCSSISITETVTIASNHQIQNHQIQLYPTKITEQFIIEFENNNIKENATIFIYNETGQLLKKEQLDIATKIIDISYFLQGVYFVKIQNGKQWNIYKIIKI